MDESGDGASRLVVNATCAIDPSEIEWRFGPSGGPGGQHANRAHTRAEARFDVEGSPSLTAGQRARITGKLGSSVTVTVDETRSQARNRAIAYERLRVRLAAALVVERPRRPTKPSRAAKTRRLDAKRKRGEIKRGRGRPGSAED